MLKKIIKYILVFIIFIVFFMVSLTVTSAFPSSWIKDNVKKSAETLVKEGNRKDYFAFEKLLILEFDNYSDALMINTAYSIDNTKPLFSAFVARKNYIPGKTKSVQEDFVGNLKSDSKYKKLDQVSELNDVVNGDIDESFEYARYWNGYLIFLRPLLLLFDYWQIRIILLLVFAILAIWLLTLIAKKIGKIMALIFGLSLLFIEYFYMGLSLLSSSMFLIMMISSIILIKRFDKIKDVSLMFFIIGMLVGFFGLLDVPLITLGGVLILYLVLVDKYRDHTVKQKVLDIIKFSVIWVIGYALTWVTKWVLVDLIYDRSIIKTGIMQVLYRTVGESIPPIFAIIYNIAYMLEPFMLIIISLIFILGKCISRISKKTIKNSIPYFLVALIPFGWYVVLANHSFLHCFFTYRNLYLTMLGIMIGIYMICNINEKAENKKIEFNKGKK